MSVCARWTRALGEAYPWCLVALAALLGLHPAGAQQHTVATRGCVPGTNYEREGFRIRSARVHSPFGFLTSVRTLRQAANSRVAALRGSPFRYDKVREARAEVDSLKWLPDREERRVRVDLILTSVENCNARELDVVFYVYSTQLAAIPSLTWESRQTEERSPQTTAGVDRAPGRLRVSPRFAYDRSNKFQAGGAISVVPAAHAGGPIDSVGVTGLGSSRSHSVAATTAGQHEFDDGWLASARWDLSYENSATSALNSTLRDEEGGASVAVTTRAIAGRFPLRFGTSLEGGSSERDGASAQGGVADTGYRSLKLFAGTATRARRHIVSGSFGVELGGTGGSGVDWTKMVLDVGHEFSVLLRDHRPFEVESRLTAGRLDARGPLPPGALFFGGSRERLFVSTADWEVRGSPIVRSIPANDFTVAGAGGDRFVAYNLTLSYPVWHRPLVPHELSSDTEFTSLLQEQLVSAVSLLQALNVTRDAHFQNGLVILKGIPGALTQFKNTIGQVQATLPADARAEVVAALRRCSSATNVASRLVDDALADQTVGSVVILLPSEVHPNGEDRLNRVVELCTTGADAPISGPAAATLKGTLHPSVARLSDEFRQIDTAKAALDAHEELAPAERVLRTLLYEANLVSIGPTVMFDAAWLRAAGESATGLGVGVGVRAIFVSSMSVTVGYALNPQQRVGNPAGAFFFSLQFRDLFE